MSTAGGLRCCIMVTNFTNEMMFFTIPGDRAKLGKAWGGSNQYVGCTSTCT